MERYRHRITTEELDFICELRGNGKTHIDYRFEECRDTIQFWVNAKEWETLCNRRQNKQEDDKPIKTAKIKRLFFDIETSPMVVYSWRIGNKISIAPENIIESWKIITICYKWEYEDVVHSLVWDNQDDKDMLKEFIKIAKSSDEMVAHNGDRFDIKKLRTRCVYHRVPMMPKYRTLDTLKKSRGYFAFDSNKLDSIGEYLGVGRKMKHKGFELWVKCLNGDEEALNNMVEYCQQDVVLLEDIFHAMENYVKPNTHAGVHRGLKKWSCPCCASGNIEMIKADVTQKGTISRVVGCKSCGHTYNISNKAYMDYFNDLINNNKKQ